MSGHRNPDIQRLLASLRNAGQQPSTTPNRLDTNAGESSIWQPSSTSSNNNIPGLGFLPAQEREVQSATSSKPSTPQPVSHSLPSELSRERSTTPLIPDASTIITWPAALKHVTKHIVSNEKAATKIKHLIAEQHKHERQWWAGRQAIVERQSGRAGNQAKVADLLKSLGGASVPVAVQDPKSDQTELEAYDRKVYKSLTDMAADYDRQLRGLQIPFFAIKHDLVILEEGLQKEGAAKGRLDKGELRELQRRMLDTLEDLFSDD